MSVVYLSSKRARRSQEGIVAILLIACDDNNTGWIVCRSDVSRWGDLQERGEWLKAVEWLAIVVGCEVGDGEGQGGMMCFCCWAKRERSWTCDVREKPGS